MFHILWHNISIIITIFPGIILFGINRFSWLKKKNEMDKYALCLLFVVILNLFARDSVMLQKVVILLVTSIFLFVLEYIMTNIKKVEGKQVYCTLLGIKRALYILLVYPICEEIIYRYMIYSYVDNIYKNFVVYMLFSVFTFIFAHFFSQKMKCLYKIPFAIAEGLLYWGYKDIGMCIILHMAYNMLAYVYNSEKYKRSYY